MFFPFIDKISKFSNVYYVNGNHEEGHSSRKELYRYIENHNIKYLSNKTDNITIKNKDITLMGLDDGRRFETYYFKDNESIKNNYRILLSHRPEKWNNYISPEHEYNPDLILSGHAHGGQFRFFNQGLVAPDQGLLPTYDAGLYSFNEIHMIVSRGIGNSILSYRFNNKPHVPIITVNI
ncbi:hypothetical protein BN85405300 [Alteracholeplasma palmae J233]|uniref:Calcineurin-like phosphoesterase domain-containing protein n=1 Tax=Alteracholeplasma palmae (strain ATCC 49389 / J233) TaxID=1318466 RepID=U4KKH1_ALTPJ|nr:hypothetical protein BN85405300 [Alteracholeplasma palmae J233]